MAATKRSKARCQARANRPSSTRFGDGQHGLKPLPVKETTPGLDPPIALGSLMGVGHSFRATYAQGNEEGPWISAEHIHHLAQVVMIGVIPEDQEVAVHLENVIALAGVEPVQRGEQLLAIGRVALCVLPCRTISGRSPE